MRESTESNSNGNRDNFLLTLISLGRVYRVIAVVLCISVFSSLTVQTTKGLLERAHNLKINSYEKTISSLDAKLKGDPAFVYIEDDSLRDTLVCSLSWKNWLSKNQVSVVGVLPKESERREISLERRNEDPLTISNVNLMWVISDLPVRFNCSETKNCEVTEFAGNTVPIHIFLYSFSSSWKEKFR